MYMANEIVKMGALNLFYYYYYFPLEVPFHKLALRCYNSLVDFVLCGKRKEKKIVANEIVSNRCLNFVLKSRLLVKYIVIQILHAKCVKKELLT